MACKGVNGPLLIQVGHSACGILMGKETKTLEWILRFQALTSEFESCLNTNYSLTFLLSSLWIGLAGGTTLGHPEESPGHELR